MEYSIQTTRKEDQRRHGLQDVFMILGLFSLLYNPPIFPFNSMHIVGLLSVFYLLLHFRRTAYMVSNLPIGGLLGIIVCWFLYLLLVVVFLNAESFAFTILPIYFLIDIIPFGMAVKIIFEDNCWDEEDFFKLVVIAAVIQAVLALMAFLEPKIQSFFVSKFLDYGYGQVVVNLSAHRFYGFAAGLTFEMPVLQTIIALLIIHPSRKLKLFHPIIALFLFFSALINGRVSIIVAVIGLFTMIIADRLPLKKRLRYGIIILWMIIIVSFFLFWTISALSPSTYHWIREGLEEIVMFLFKGKVGTSDASYFGYMVNPDKYRMPGGTMEILFGVGHPTMGTEYKYGYQSDIGYVNDMWLGGVFYMFFLYLFFGMLMWILRGRSNLRVSFLGTYMLLAYPFINIKGIAASANSFSYLLVIFFIVSTGNKRHDYEKMSPQINRY